MSLAIAAIGTLFKVGDGASPEVFATIPECNRVVGPDVRVELMDVTSHDSAGGFREFLPGLKDGDNVAADVHWVPSNAVHKALRVDAYASNLRNFKIVYPDDTDNTVTFSGYIQGFPPAAAVAEVLRNSLSVKVTGMPQWS